MRPKLLYIAPMPPSDTGSGLAMRSGAVLRALARDFRVSLLVAIVPLRRGTRPIDPAVAALCQNVWTRNGSQLAKMMTSVAGGSELRLLRTDRFQAVHIHRLSVAWAFRPWLDQLPASIPRYLDLDDVESVSHARAAAIARELGQSQKAQQLENRSTAFAAQEQWALDFFDRIYVCSDLDAARLPQDRRARVLVLPNTVQTPRPITPPRRVAPFTFLFIGSFGHLPNLDAALHFFDEVLPLVQERSTLPVRFLIAGRRATEFLPDRIAHAPGIEVRSDVEDISALYAETDAVVVPLRAGGGTRIKILEAFAFQRPVISSSIGAEGIDAQHGTHLLIADSPLDFASACLEVMQDEALAGDLASNGYRLHRVRYSPARLTQVLAGYDDEIIRVPPSSAGPPTDDPTLGPM